MILAENIYMNYPIPKRYLEYITKPFKTEKYTAVKGINLKIEEGDRVAFLGANGAGKTTFLKIVGGLLYPSSGRLLINNYDTQKENLKARKRVGFVLNEERSFYWRLTGKQNLLFFGVLDNIFGEELNNRADELLKLVGLDASKDNSFSGYSSGMKQRLAIARGMISNPEILILDEPTRTLDPISAESITNIISEKIHNKKERTILIATHSLTEAKKMCNKICLMKEGRVVDFSMTSSLIDQYGTLEKYYKKIMNSEVILNQVEMESIY